MEVVEPAVATDDGGDDVVRLVAVLRDDRDAGVPDELQDAFFLRLEVVRRGLAVGLVVRVDGLAEDVVVAGVGDHQEVVGPTVLRELQEHLREDVGRLGRLS